MRVYACELSMDLLGKSIEDYYDVFDEVLGVAGFIGKAEGKEVLFV